ncbi:MAG: flagellar motor protein MotB [Mesorhizobium sp.]|nr:MAG: flagellar motor protein MotB [Mesorhizobium sp.]
MKRQPRILAGTALGLLMASAPLGAFPLQGSAAFDPPQSTATPLIPVQSNCPEGESAEGCPPQAEPEQKPRKKRERQAESAPAEQAAPSGEEQQGGQRRKKREQQQQEEAAPAERAAPASDEQPEPRRKKREREQQQEAAPAERPAEQAAPASDEQPEPRRKKREREQQEEAAPAERPAEQAAPASDEQPEPRRKKREREQQQEAAPAERPAEQAAPTSDEQPEPRRKKREREQQQEAAPSEQPARKQAGEQAEPLPTDQQTAPAEGDKPRDQARERGKKPADEQPVTGEQPSTGEQLAEREQAAPAEGEGPAQGEAPVFDSQKERKRRGGRDTARETGGQDAVPTQQNGEQAEAPKPAPVDQGPPPTDDRAAQQAIKLERMVRATEEKGRRVERAPEVEDIRRRPRPRGVDVVRELGDRVILQFNNQTIVESDDTPRMRRGARNVYYEELSGNRTREIVERDNGIQIVTIRNRYGDVVQRSRIAPDGREYVLSYVDERHYEDDGDWRDPGDDLPPIRIDIPREEYILDSEEVEDPDDYYAFLEQPPVERVQRLYSIDEVKRSARVRDIARRIDLDTLNFEFGSASIPETEVQKLEGVATAMEKLLEKNPAETFLIEGHTDAVGRPEANLALSDRRAEAVAEALTNAFSIPPENLTTQGYGEEYLKVDTSEPERENRRVAIRRITSLVAPVASAN